jgi:HAD superfamily hydrolase (TIGR02253 family)
LKIKAVIFDLDNTLIDFIKMKREATKAAAYAMVDAGLTADRDKLAEHLFNFYLNYDIESDDAFQKFLIQTYGKLDYRLLAAAVNAYLKEKALRLNPYPNVAETLGQIKKRRLKIALITDGLRLKAWMRLNAASLDKYFDAVVTFDDTGKKKPAREPFEKALTELAVKPEECLMVGDWPEKDMVGARDVGMITCWAKYGSCGRQGAADYVINDFSELLTIIRSIG